MTNEKLDSSILNDIDFDNIDIEKNIDKDIDEYIKKFTIVLAREWISIIASILLLGSTKTFSSI